MTKKNRQYMSFSRKKIIELCQHYSTSFLIFKTYIRLKLLHCVNDSHHSIQSCLYLTFSVRSCSHYKGYYDKKISNLIKNIGHQFLGNYDAEYIADKSLLILFCLYLDNAIVSLYLKKLSFMLLPYELKEKKITLAVNELFSRHF